MKTNPLVSVVIASFNMGQYICEAIDSVLNQDYSNVEVIVVDDGSSDDTQVKLDRYRSNQQVKLIRQNNSGQTVAKNRGLREANGDFIGFCDADNYWLPGKLAKQLPMFSEKLNVGVVYGDLQQIDAYGNSLPTPIVNRYSGKITGRLLMDNFVTFNTTLIPREVIEKIGGFDETLSMGIDYYLWLLISVDHDFLYIPEPLVAYRIWGGQMSHKTEERFKNYFCLANRFIENNPQSVTSIEIKRGWAYTYVSRGRWLLSQKRYKEASVDYFTAFKYRPYDWRLWKSLLKFFFVH